MHERVWQWSVKAACKVVRWFRVGSAVAAMMFSGTATAQSVVDSLVGKITDPKGQPVPSALVLITQRSTGAAHQAQTNRAGTFSVPVPNTPRGYSIAVTAVGFTTARLNVQRDSTIAARQNIVANFQLVASATQLKTLQVNASRRPRFVSPDDDRLNVGNSRRDVALDVLNGRLDGDLAALVGAIAGFSTVDGGFSVLGLGADQNTTTIGGITVDVPGLPRDALANASVTTSSSNAANGGYSGAQVALSLFTVAESERTLRFTLKPQTFASGGGSSSLSAKQQSEFQLGGRALGPWLGDRGSYGMSFQYAHTGAGSQGLEASRIPVLNDLGLSSDSIGILLNHANTLGIIRGAPVRTRSDDQGSLTFGLNIRFNPDRSATTRLVASGSRVSNDYLSPLTVGSAGANSNRYSIAWVSTLTQYVKSVIRTSYTLGLQDSRSQTSSLLNIPSARVTLANLEAGAGGDELSVATVSLGGNPNGSRPGRSQSADLLGRAGWMTINSKHEIELAAASRLESFHSDPSRNLLGTYTFATLHDFVTNQPSSYVRTVNGSPRDASVSYSWASASDSWRLRPSFTALFSARYDFARVLTELPQNSFVLQKFGVNTSNTPQLNRISPRIGFSWDIEQATVKPVRGAPPRESRPRGVLSGGYALKVNALRASAVNPVLGASGTDEFNRELRCEGAGVPAPQWVLYANETADIPLSCVSQASSVPSSGARTRISAFSNKFEPSRNWTGNLAWRSQLSRKNSVAAEFIHMLSNGGTSRFDANLQTIPRYFATNDGNRAVFVRPTEIVSANGLVPLVASRIDSTYSTVSELRSDLKSRANQLRVSFRRNIGGLVSDALTVGYVYLDAESQSRTSSGIAGDPRTNVVSWNRSGQNRHDVTLGFSKLIAKSFQGTIYTRVSGGGRFTPSVSGDINGDGLYNDRPFVTTDIAQSASQTLSKPARACLQRQEGRIASINSCAAPLNYSMHAMINIPDGKLMLPKRIGAKIYINNLPAAADLLLHGSNARGWGAPAYADPTLLTVRGYDQANKQFAYAINPRFGQKSKQSAWFGQGARITIEGSISLSPDPLKQRVAMYRRGGYSLPIWNRASADEIFTGLRGNSPSVMTQLLRAPDSVGISPEQRAKIDTLSKELIATLDAELRPIATAMAEATTNTSEMGKKLDAAQLSARLAQRRIILAAQAVLSTDQLRRMGASFRRQVMQYTSAEQGEGGR